MGSIARPLLLLHSDPVFRLQVRDAVIGEFGLEEVACWGELADALKRTARPVVVVVDPYWETDGSRLAPELRALLERFPATPVLAAVDVAIERVSDIRVMLAWGVAEIIGNRHHGLAGIAALLDAALRRSTDALLRRVVPPWVSQRAHPILVAAADTAQDGGGERELAEALQTNGCTLGRWCELTRLPAPERLIEWFRVLRAADMLDAGEFPGERIARCCGFGSEAALEAALRELVGIGTVEPAGSRALETAASRFRAALDVERRLPMERPSRETPPPLPAM
jgi:hypothetical protein